MKPLLTEILVIVLVGSILMLILGLSSAWRIRRDRRNEEDHLAIIQAMIMLKPEAHGPALQQEAEKILGRSMVWWGGNFYVVLDKMQRDGILESRWADMPRPRARIYRFTERFIGR